MKPSKRDNFFNALKSLEAAISLPIENDRDVAGIIQNFEFVYELSWKYLKFVLAEQGINSNSPKDVFTQAYKINMIADEKVWLDIIKDRNLSVHTYNKLLADEMVQKIIDTYTDAFKILRDIK